MATPWQQYTQSEYDRLNNLPLSSYFSDSGGPNPGAQYGLSAAAWADPTISGYFNSGYDNPLDGIGATQWNDIRNRAATIDNIYATKGAAGVGQYIKDDQLKAMQGNVDDSNKYLYQDKSSGLFDALDGVVKTFLAFTGGSLAAGAMGAGAVAGGAGAGGADAATGLGSIASGATPAAASAGLGSTAATAGGLGALDAAIPTVTVTGAAGGAGLGAGTLAGLGAAGAAGLGSIMGSGGPSPTQTSPVSNPETPQPTNNQQPSPTTGADPTIPKVTVTAPSPTPAAASGAATGGAAGTDDLMASWLAFQAAHPSTQAPPKVTVTAPKPTTTPTQPAPTSSVDPATAGAVGAGLGAILGSGSGGTTNNTPDPNIPTVTVTGQRPPTTIPDSSLPPLVTPPINNTPIPTSIPADGTGGTPIVGLPTGGSNTPTGTIPGLNDILNVVGTVGSGIAGYQMNQADKDYYQGLLNKMMGMYQPGTPEADLMQHKMDAQDAAAGRNSQYGIRAQNLAAMLAQQRAQIMTSPTFGRIAEDSRGHYDSGISSLAGLLGQASTSGTGLNTLINNGAGYLGSLFS